MYMISAINLSLFLYAANVAMLIIFANTLFKYFNNKYTAGILLLIVIGSQFVTTQILIDTVTTAIAALYESTETIA